MLAFDAAVRSHTASFAMIHEWFTAPANAADDRSMSSVDVVAVRILVRNVAVDEHCIDSPRL